MDAATIARLRSQGRTVREIAAELGRRPWPVQTSLPLLWQDQAQNCSPWGRANGSNLEKQRASRVPIQESKPRTLQVEVHESFALVISPFQVFSTACERPSRLLIECSLQTRNHLVDRAAPK